MLSHVELGTALELLNGVPVRTAAERVPLTEALGRVLAEDCRTHLSVPPFDKSPFDGYAYRTADVPGTLRVIGTAAAGCQELPELGPGEALRIFTGAPVPPGADAVARQEDVTAGDGTVVIPGDTAPGTNIVRRGEDLREGDRLLNAGTRLEPGHLGLLASQGFAEDAARARAEALLDEKLKEVRPVILTESFAAKTFLEKNYPNRKENFLFYDSALAVFGRTVEGYDKRFDFSAIGDGAVECDKTCGVDLAVNPRELARIMIRTGAEPHPGRTAACESLKLPKASGRYGKLLEKTAWNLDREPEVFELNGLTCAVCHNLARHGDFWKARTSST